MEAFLLCDSTDPQSVLPRCRAEGFGIEVQAFYHPAALADSNLVDATAEAIEGVTPLSVHGPFGDLCPGSFDPMVRDLARLRLERAHEVAVRLDAEHIVLHHGYVPHTSPPSGWIPRSRDFWRALLDRVTAKMRVHLENLLEIDPEMIAAVVDEVDRPNLDIALDIGHAHCRSRGSVLDWIEALGARIGYVHLHDNCGKEDEHLALGAGTIPLPEVCAALEERAPRALWALEVAADDVEPSLGVLSGCGVQVEQALPQ
ncbi:MAG: sugar phosphate isomerase/epimerase [Candidatus Bipolaricaulota bacterium]|nr:MAG: sugar phosphate isomerase/epimerase [Candidatus Bipolaricaulota bacterium]